MAVNCYFTQIEVRNAFCNLFEIEHTEFFNSSIFYVSFTIVKDAGNIFSKRRLDRAKFKFYCISDLLFTVVMVISIFLKYQ